MPEDDDWGDNPGKQENRHWPGATEKARIEELRERAREEIERRERREPERDRDEG